ncbi:MAG: hypothetical protein V1815_03065 [Candidatus Woesearchaeota archaeon]
MKNNNLTNKIEENSFNSLEDYMRNVFGGITRKNFDKKEYQLAQVITEKFGCEQIDQVYQTIFEHFGGVENFTIEPLKPITWKQIIGTLKEYYQSKGFKHFGYIGTPLLAIKPLGKDRNYNNLEIGIYPRQILRCMEDGKVLLKKVTSDGDIIWENELHSKNEPLYDSVSTECSKLDSDPSGLRTFKEI